MISFRNVFVGVVWGLVGMLLLSVAMTARAGQAEVTWQPPTQNCDGSPVGELASYTLTYGQTKQTLPLAPLSHTVTGLKPGDWWFSLSVTNKAGEESQFVTAEKTIPPEEFVTKSNNVYTFFRSNGNISVVKTNHTVATGVVCDATQSVNGKYKVSLEDVVWLGAKLTPALADCG